VLVFGCILVFVIFSFLLAHKKMLLIRKQHYFFVSEFSENFGHPIFVDLADFYSAEMEVPRIDDTLCQIETNELLDLDLRSSIREDSCDLIL
jgi:hypothetical protein